jgi:acetyltransferase
MSRGYHAVTRLALEEILGDPGVDAAVLITPAYLDPEQDSLDVTAMVREIAGKFPDKPLAAWVFGPHRPAWAKKLEQDQTIVVYPSPESAARSLGALYSYHHRIKNAPAVEEAGLAGPAAEKIKGLLRKAGKNGGELLGAEALEVIAHCGIPTVRTIPAHSPGEAVRAAGELGFPVVMKLNSPDVSHKSDVGGVLVGLKTADEVSRAFDSILQSAAQKAPGARLQGVLLQSCLSGGTETIIGARRDRQFGPVLVYGLGGIYTEVFRDVSFRVAPVDTGEALSMIEETRSYKILQGARGRQPADFKGLAGALAGLSRLVSHFPEIIEMDINPLLAGPDGVVALDCRIALAGDGHR